LIIPEKGYC